MANKIETLRSLPLTTPATEPYSPSAAPAATSRFTQFPNGKAAAKFIRGLGLKPGTNLERYEGTLVALVLDATMWARARYLGTIVMLDPDTESVKFMYNVEG